MTLSSGGHIKVGVDADKRGDLIVGGNAEVITQADGYMEVNTNSTILVTSEGRTGAGGVVIESGGLLDARFGGEMIADGGILRVKPGGQLRVSHFGSIIARNGGKIILEDGALVQLWNFGVEESDGTIHIDNGGELVIEGDYDFSGTGFFQFSAGNSVSGSGPLKITGDDKEYRRMRLNAGAVVNLSNQGFYVRDARVYYESGSSVNLSEGAFADVREGSFYDKADVAIQTDGTGNFNVRHSEFVGNDWGVYYFPQQGNGQQQSFTLRNSTFENCQIGLAVEGSSSNALSGPHPGVSTSTFKDCEIGVMIEDYPVMAIAYCDFTSVLANSYAIDGFNSGTITIRNSTASGYLNTEDGAVLLEIVDQCDVIDGSYTENRNAFVVNTSANIDFSGCVEVASNVTGIQVRSNADANILLNAINLANNTVGIKGGRIQLTSQSTNTFIKANGKLFDYTLAGPSPVVLNGNSWSGGPLVGQLPDPASYASWFATVPVDIDLSGTGCADCDSPDSCPEFCDLYPGDPRCIKEYEKPFGLQNNSEVALKAKSNPATVFVKKLMCQMEV